MSGGVGLLRLGLKGIGFQEGQGFSGWSVIEVGEGVWWRKEISGGERD